MLPDPNQRPFGDPHFTIAAIGEANCLRGFDFSTQESGRLRVTFEEVPKRFPYLPLARPLFFVQNSVGGLHPVRLTPA